MTTTSEQQPWPDELREIVYSALYGRGGMGPDGPAVVEHLLAVIDASPYTVVRRDEYEALRSFWSYTESGMDIVALSPAEELRAIYAERTGGSDE